MSTEQNKLLSHLFIEEVGKPGNLAAGGELHAEVEQEALASTIFRLALALATETSKLGQLRQMLVLLREQRAISEDFSTWAIGRVDERVESMALEYTHDAEVMVQILSFKGGTFDSLTQDIEDLYQHEQITQGFMSERNFCCMEHKRKWSSSRIWCLAVKRRSSHPFPRPPVARPLARTA